MQTASSPMHDELLRLLCSPERDEAFLRSVAAALRIANGDCELASALDRTLDAAEDLRRVAAHVVRVGADVSPAVPSDNLRAGLLAIPGVLRHGAQARQRPCG